MTVRLPAVAADSLATFDLPSEALPPPDDAIPRAMSLGHLCVLLVDDDAGFARPEDRQQTKQAGFDLHLAKPVDRTTLVDAALTVTSL